MNITKEVSEFIALDWLDLMKRIKYSNYCINPNEQTCVKSTISTKPKLFVAQGSGLIDTIRQIVYNDLKGTINLYTTIPVNQEFKEILNNRGSAPRLIRSDGQLIKYLMHARLNSAAIQLKDGHIYFTKDFMVFNNKYQPVLMPEYVGYYTKSVKKDIDGKDFITVWVCICCMKLILDIRYVDSTLGKFIFNSFLPAIKDYKHLLRYTGESFNYFNSQDINYALNIYPLISDFNRNNSYLGYCENPISIELRDLQINSLPIENEENNYYTCTDIDFSTFPLMEWTDC